MTATISRLFDNYGTAQQAVRALETAGVPHSDISIVASNADGWYAADHATRAAGGATPDRIDRNANGIDDRAEGSGAGAGIGAVVGGGAGLLAGLGLLAIPGLGPVVAAGWLASTALGAVVGGTAGGLIGALTAAGVSKEDAHVYAEGIRRGGTLVTARVLDADRAKCESILNRASVNIQDRGAAYRKAGWEEFDVTGTPYTADQVRRERELYRQ
jgi:hypothetical protein